MNFGRRVADFVGCIPGLKGITTIVQLACREHRALKGKGFKRPLVLASWVPRGTHPHVILVGHEATRTGAPMVLLRLAQHLRSTKDIGCRVVLLADGPLRKNFTAVAPTIVMPNVVKAFAGLADMLRKSSSPCVVFCNTIATAGVAEQCRLHGVPVVTWIHETITMIDEHFGGRKTVQCMAHASRQIVCSSQGIATSLTETHGIPLGNILVVPLGIDAPPANLDRAEERQAVRKELGLRPEARIVLACGTLEQRKGTDLFVQLAAKVINLQPTETDEVHFVWVGRGGDQSKVWLDHDAHHLGLSKRIHFIGEKEDPARYFAAADVFAFPSREESCGMVALEAAAAGCPVVLFDGPIGVAEMLSENEATFVPYLDVDAMATAVRTRLDGDQNGASETPIWERYPWSRCMDDVTKAIQAAAEPPTFDKTRERSTGPGSIAAWQQASGQDVLVISFGPPPIPGVSAVEGTGLRSWGLASALAKAVPESVVTLAIPGWYDLPMMPAEFEGVRIARWGRETLAEMIAEHDVVVASYCLGDYSVLISDALLEHQVLVWDAYVPIHIEVCARRSVNRASEFVAYEKDRPIWEVCLKRGDYFLCATEAQQSYYTGVLAAIGRINPISYDDDPFLIVPYGVHETEAVLGRRPCSELIPAPGAWKLLWFGGVYPWFDIGCLLEAVKVLSKKHAVGLVIVGAKNPYVDHPDFKKSYERMKKMIEDPAIAPFVHLVDWVPFHERGNWYLDADLICFANQPGMENLFAWRTRVVDYLWTRTPLATNGGDPLGEEMIAAGAAVRIDATNPEVLADTLAATLDNAKKLAAMRQAADAIREKYLWKNAIRPLAEVVRGTRVG